MHVTVYCKCLVKLDRPDVSDEDQARKIVTYFRREHCGVTEDSAGRRVEHGPIGKDEYERAIAKLVKKKVEAKRRPAPPPSLPAMAGFRVIEGKPRRETPARGRLIDASARLAEPHCERCPVHYALSARRRVDLILAKKGAWEGKVLCRACLLDAYFPSTKREPVTEEVQDKLIDSLPMMFEWVSRPGLSSYPRAEGATDGE